MVSAQAISFVFSILSLGTRFGAAAPGKSGFGQACNQNNTHLDSSTWSLDTDCDATTFCATNQTCAYRGCRSDVYPYGYSGVPFNELPPLCGEGYFCPDEGSQCLPLVPIGSQCQKDRDDECQYPSNWRDLAGYLNVNGTVCLNFTCMLANVNLGQTCQTENTPFVGFTSDGSTYSYIVSRDNCANGLYCDGASSQCLRTLAMGAACNGNKQCMSYNCVNNQYCGRAPDSPIQPATWNYVVIGLGIVILILGTFVSLWFIHRRTRNENQRKLEQYYNEQLAYRQSIMSMSHAKNSLLAMPATTTPEEARRSLISQDFAYSSQLDLPLPPNIRRDSSVGGWSDGGSEILEPEPDSRSDPFHGHGSEESSGPRYRG